MPSIEEIRRMLMLKDAAAKVVSRTPFMERWPVIVVYSDGKVQVCNEFLSRYYSIERRQCERIEAGDKPLAAFVFVDSRVLSKYKLSTGLRTGNTLAKLLARRLDAYSQWVVVEEVEYDYDVIPGDMVELVYSDDRRSIIELNYRKAVPVKARALKMCAEQYKDEFRRLASGIGVEVIDVRLCLIDDSMCVMPCVVIPLDVSDIYKVLDRSKPQVYKPAPRIEHVEPVTLTLPELSLEEVRPEEKEKNHVIWPVVDNLNVE